MAEAGPKVLGYNRCLPQTGVGQAHLVTKPDSYMMLAMAAFPPFVTCPCLSALLPPDGRKRLKYSPASLFLPCHLVAGSIGRKTNSP